MRGTRIVMLAALALSACSTSNYNLPEEKRTRLYDAPTTAVWSAAIAALPDAKFTLIDADEDDLELTARTGIKWTSWRGFELRVLVRECPGGTCVRVGCEDASNSINDWGGSKHWAKNYLTALDRRMGVVKP